MIEERAQELFRARCLDRDCATAPWVIGKERAINSWAQPPAWAIEAALDLLEGIQGIAEEHTDGVKEAIARLQTIADTIARLQHQCDNCGFCGGEGVAPTTHDPRDPAWGRECGHCYYREGLIADLRAEMSEMSEMSEGHQSFSKKK